MTVADTRIKHEMASFFYYVQQRDYFRYTYQTCDRTYLFSCAAKGLFPIHVSNMGYNVSFLMCRKGTISYTRIKHGIESIFLMCSKGTISDIRIKHGIEKIFSHVQ